jgi:hypothetical protein
MPGIEPSDDFGAPFAGLGGSAREDWRAEEESYIRAAAEQWAHRRSLADRARDWVHRGDELAVVTGPARFIGVAVAAGPDLLSIRTTAGRVDLPLPSCAVTVVAAAHHPGRPASAAAISWRARMLEHETARHEVAVGRRDGAADLRGRLVVGHDHVIVVDDDRETFVAAASISWVARWR